MSQIGINFGIITESVKAQLKKQGFFVEKIDKYEEIHRAIPGMFILGLITEAEKHRICQRFVKAIAKEAKAIGAK